MVNPVSNPGTNDISYRVFLIYTARITNFKRNFYGPTPQGEFLRAKGKNERAGRLKHDSSIQQISDIDLAAKRLTDRKEMRNFLE